MFRVTDMGDNLEEVVETEECKVLRLRDESGDGLMTIYRVFDGVYLMYNDFHMARCTSRFASAARMFCVDHCREGRIEQSVHHSGRVDFPVSHYHGLTIGFFLDEAETVVRNAMPAIAVDISALADVAARVVMMVTQGILTTAVVIGMILCFDLRIGGIAAAGAALFFAVNTLLQEKAKALAPEKDVSDRAIVEKVLEYVQGIAEVRAYNLAGEKSRALSAAIDENTAASIRTEMAFVPVMFLQSLVSELIGVAVAIAPCCFISAARWSFSTPW